MQPPGEQHERALGRRVQAGVGAGGAVATGAGGAAAGQEGAHRRARDGGERVAGDELSDLRRLQRRHQVLQCTARSCTRTSSASRRDSVDKSQLMEGQSMRDIDDELA